MKPEVSGFTPLQLAIVSPKPSAKVIRALFGMGDIINHEILEQSTGNNILHLAAKYCTRDSADVVEYIVKNAKIDLFARNNAGDTPLIIASAVQN